MLTPALTETATWKRVTNPTTNGYPDPVSTSQEIKVRWEDKVRLIRTEGGQEVVSMATVFTEAAVEPGDVLAYGGREVTALAVAQAKSPAGAVLFREVSV